MSGGGASMDSIPNSVRNMIQDIKEISRIHTEEEILAMLRECSMDPNETVQKLLSQDTFHEVKRKRDRRKENSNVSPPQNSSNREPADSRWKPGMQRREVRSGRGTYSSRYMSRDVGVIRNFNAGKENGVSQVTEKSITSTSLGAHEMRNDSGVLPSSYASGVTNGPNKPEVLGSSQGSGSQMPAAAGFPSGDESSIAETSMSRSALSPPADGKSGSETVVDVMHGQPVQSSHQIPSPGWAAPVSGVYASASDSVPVPSLESHAPGAVGTVKHEFVSKRVSVDSTTSSVVCDDVSGFEIPSSERVTSELGTSSMRGKMQTKSEDIDVIRLSDAPQPSSNSQFNSSGSRPSSNYSNRSQQSVGPQKVGPGKEWKPKSSSQIPAQVSGTIDMSDAVPITIGMNAQFDSGVLEEGISQLNKKMEEFHFSDDQHVIIPNHLQVPEAERTGLSFGSFDVSFTLGTRFLNGPCSEKCSMPLTDSSQAPGENLEEPVLSTQNTSIDSQGEDSLDHPPTPPQIPENLSSRETDISSNISAVPEYDQNKQEAAVAQGPQFSVVHTAPTYSAFGLIPPMLGSQLAPFESSEPQAHDASPIPRFVQPFDPSTGYYTQVYQPGGDASGRFSPFLAHDTTATCNGNVAVVSSQAGQAVQESANTNVVSTTGPTPVVTQTGVMQTSVAVTQQPVPVFRQPGGVHISHYPPSYLPYQYFSPFYAPPPTIQHFLNNTAFLQQPLAGSMYPPPAAAAATNPAKNSLSQFKNGANSGNSTHSGMPTGYGPYNSTPTGYNPGPAGTSGNSTGNEDITMLQYKENDVYITGQQSEGSAPWVPAPGQDIPSVQASSLYNISPQGQHVAFAALQSGHGVFSGIYHPSQSMAAATVHSLLRPTQTMAAAVDMVGRPPGVYQQPQRAQINWANNY